MSEKAVGYFERAALMQPQEPKWQLMVASCYRRSGNYHRALETYKMIHRRFPANIECLKFLVPMISSHIFFIPVIFVLEPHSNPRAKSKSKV